MLVRQCETCFPYLLAVMDSRAATTAAVVKQNFKELLCWGRSAEVLEGDIAAEGAGVLVPWHCQACLDGDAGADSGRQNGLAVGVVLLVEPLKARSRNDAGCGALGFELLGCLDRRLNLGTGCHEDDVWRFLGTFDQNVSAAANAVACLLLGALENRQVLAGQRQAPLEQLCTRMQRPMPARSRWRLPDG